MCVHSGITGACTQRIGGGRGPHRYYLRSLRVHSDITSMCVNTMVILVHVHSDITSACEHTVVLLVRAHSGNTSVCTQ